MVINVDSVRKNWERRSSDKREMEKGEGSK